MTLPADEVAASYYESIKSSRSVLRTSGWRRHRFMRTVSRDSLLEIARHGAEPSMNDAFIPEEIIDYFSHTGSFAALNDLAAYLKDHGPLDGSDPIDQNLIPLDYLAHPAFSPYSKASKSERAYQHAVIQAAYQLDDEYLSKSSVLGIEFSTITLQGSNVHDYLREYPENAGKLVRIINDRGIHPANDMDQIAELIAIGDETGSALSEGML